MYLIISDLDGTMIHRSKYTNKTLETVKQLKNTEHIFTIATGRHLNATRKIVENFDIKYPVICSNGAVIYDFSIEKILYQQSIEQARVIEIIDHCNQLNLSYLIYTTKIIYASSTKVYEAFTKRVGTFNVVMLDDLKDVFDQGVTKILVIEEDKQLIDQLKENIKNIDDISYVQSQPTFLDIGHINANKGHALMKLKAFINHPIDQVIAIGDQENDIQMIEQADIGIAMGDGHPHLLGKADFITKPFEDDGFALAMKKFIFVNVK